MTFVAEKEGKSFCDDRQTQFDARSVWGSVSGKVAFTVDQRDRVYQVVYSRYGAVFCTSLIVRKLEDAWWM